MCVQTNDSFVPLYSADEITTRVALDRYAGEKVFSRLGLPLRSRAYCQRPSKSTTETVLTPPPLGRDAQLPLWVVGPLDLVLCFSSRV